MNEFWGILIIVALFVGGTVILASAEDYRAEIVDQQGCRVVEYVENPVFFGEKTRTVQTYCPVED